MRILFFCFFLLLLAQSKAQYFDAGVSFGIVGSQVDGDSYGGYNKLGFAANFWVSRSISKKWNATFGIGYIQKGSVKPKNISKNDYSYYKMVLQYIEVPIVFNRQVYSKTVVEIGIVNSKLLKAVEKDAYGVLPISVPFKEYELSYLLGVSYKLTEKTSVFGKVEYTSFVTPLRWVVSMHQNREKVRQLNNLIIIGLQQKI